MVMAVTAKATDNVCSIDVRSAGVWTLAFIYFAVIMSFYGVSLWLPQIVQAFSGMSDVLVGFDSAIPYLAAAIGMVLIGRSSDRRRERPRHVAAAAFAGAAGLVAAAYLKMPAAELAAWGVRRRYSGCVSSRRIGGVREASQWPSRELQA